MKYIKIDLKITRQPPSIPSQYPNFSLKNSSALCNFYCSHVNVISGYVLLLIYDFNLELGLALADPGGGGREEYAHLRAPISFIFMRFLGKKLAK